MKAKQIVAGLVVIIVIVIIGGTLKARKEKLATQEYIEWFNGWTSDLVKIRTTYHEQVGLMTVPDTTNYDYTNPVRLKEMISFLEQTRKIELWKIDTSLSVSEYWYNRIDQILTSKLTQEQISFVKSYLLDGEQRGISFRQLTVAYLDDYLKLFNYMFDIVISGKKMDSNDIVKYNDLQTNYIRSQEIYTKKVNDIYAYNVKRVEEFNQQFKNSNVAKMLTLVKGD